jgi:hypothetical protein
MIIDSCTAPEADWDVHTFRKLCTYAAIATLSSNGEHVAGADMTGPGKEATEP